MRRATSKPPCKAWPRETRNDRTHHRVVGAKHHARTDRDVPRRSGRHLRASPSAARRHPRSLGHAGHRLHHLSGPGAAGGRGSVTYPLATAMLTVPKSKVVRGFSFFGVSFVYIIFEDGTDIYWARSRVIEYLNAAAARLPAGITPV